MIRVVEEEDDEDNYLRKLEDENGDSKQLGRPYSTTQKGSQGFKSNLATKMNEKSKRKLTDEKVEDETGQTSKQEEDDQSVQRMR